MVSRLDIWRNISFLWLTFIFLIKVIHTETFRSETLILRDLFLVKSVKTRFIYFTKNWIRSCWHHSNKFLTGLTTLSYNGSIKSGMSVIQPFPPGHVETYKLDTEGRAFLEETARYHKIGETPSYTTFEVALGNYHICSQILFQF